MQIFIIFNHIPPSEKIANMKCACCGSEDAEKNCIVDFIQKRRLVLFTTRCRCELPAPVCHHCHSLRGLDNFTCHWCSEIASSYIERSQGNCTPRSIQAILLHQKIGPMMDSSRLFRSFGMITPDLSQWRNLASFFTELNQPFIYHIFYLFMYTKTNKFRQICQKPSVKKVLHISQNIFQLDDKQCQHSAYMNNVVRMLQYLSFTVTLSIGMFRMNHRVEEKHHVIFQKHDAFFTRMICKRILSNFANSEASFWKILSRR